MSQRRFAVGELVSFSMGDGIVTDVSENGGIFIYKLQDEHGITSCPDRPEFEMKAVHKDDVEERRLKIENAILRKKLSELQLLLYKQGYRGPEIQEKW